MPLRRASALEPSLIAAERRIALLSRCQPRNADAEQARALALLERGRPDNPRFEYERVPDLSELRAELDRVASELERGGALEGLYAARARELALEAALAASVGRPEFAELARTRFGCVDVASPSAMSDLAEQWIRGDAGTQEGASGDASEVTSVCADDASHPGSLLSRLRAELGRQRLPWRVEVRRQSAAAAVGAAVVYVAEGRVLSLPETERVVVHEVEGHVLPRFRAARGGRALFAPGSARGNDEQEGYALHCEQRAGYLDPARMRELGLRHVAAESVHRGATWVETAEVLQTRGATPGETVAIASRVHRGGGLGRERIYLPAWHRVTTALSTEPEVNQWLRAGRVSLDAIRTLKSLGEQLDASPLA